MKTCGGQNPQTIFTALNLKLPENQGFVVENYIEKIVRAENYFTHPRLNISIFTPVPTYSSLHCNCFFLQDLGETHM